MMNRRLNQKIHMALDVLAMRGPVTIMEVSDRALQSMCDDDWCLADLSSAKKDAVKVQVRRIMGQPCGDHFREHCLDLSLIPKSLLKTFDKLPRFICISARGGRGSQHVLVEQATIEHWGANIALKSRIAQSIEFSRDDSRNVRDLLVANGVGCLSDLGKKKAA